MTPEESALKIAKFTMEVFQRIVPPKMADALVQQDDVGFAADMLMKYFNADAASRADIEAFFESDGPAKVEDAHWRHGGIPTPGQLRSWMEGQARLNGRGFDQMVKAAQLDPALMAVSEVDSNIDGAIGKLRALNRAPETAREFSLALTKLEEASLWLGRWMDLRMIHKHGSKDQP